MTGRRGPLIAAGADVPAEDHEDAEATEAEDAWAEDTEAEDGDLTGRGLQRTVDPRGPSTSIIIKTLSEQVICSRLIRTM